MAPYRQRILDFHARLAAGPDALRRLTDSMDRHGIDRAVVSAGGVLDPNRLARQAVEGGEYEGDADNGAVLAGRAATAGRLIPFYFANPHRDATHYRRLAQEFRGLELSPAVHGVPLTDRRTVNLVEVARDHRHPTYVVCLGRPGSDARALAELARAFSTVTFVLGHCGFTAIDLYALSLVAPVHNIVAETSGCYYAVTRTALDLLGPDRVLFGTEYPLQHPSVELAKLAALDLPEPVAEQLTWHNANRILAEEQT